MAINAIDNKTYTYTDYLNFTDDKPVEIIDGEFQQCHHSSQFTKK